MQTQKNLLFKKLSIAPDGNVIGAGGYAQYTLDPATGHLSYSALLVAHYFWSDHQYPKSGVYAVDPNLLKSANVKAGQVINFGPVKITVKQVAQKKAQADLVVDGLFSGSGEISLAQDTIELESISGSGQYMGFNFKLEAK